MKLYLEDIRDIWQIFDDVAERVILQTDNYEITDLADLEKIPEKSPKTLVVRCHSPFYIELELHFRYGLLSSSDVPSALGTFQKLKERLKQNSNYFIATFAKRAVVIVISLFALTASISLLLMVLLSGSYVHLTVLSASALFGILMNVLSFLIMLKLRVKGYSVISLYSRDQVRFWDSRMGKIVIAVLATAVAGLLTLLTWRYAEPFL